jgi:NADP-dependent aldehyde dehydrogenase
MTTPVSQIMQQAQEAFQLFRQTAPEARAAFLECIADHIENLGDVLIHQAMQETNLPAPRLQGERGRTTMQLRMFASMLREGSWVEATIDTTIPEKYPPRPDLRKMLIPLGPVVVFGASNFPFAYSTAGGDTASALATGCPVVVKAHPAHLKTSSMVAGAVASAIESCQMPIHSFQHVTDTSFEAGKSLVQDPHTAAVGFTGSFSGGKALFDYAAARPKPIPVFAEMGSVNPVLLLPDAVKENHEALARQYAGSVTLGMGQFCTNPGILIGIQSPELNAFAAVLAEEMNKVNPAPMLHDGILKAYQSRREKALQQKGVQLVSAVSTIKEMPLPVPTLAKTDGANFLAHPSLQEEIFGPYSLLIVCTDMSQLKLVWQTLKGQLTTSLMATDTDLKQYPELLSIAETIAGRVVFNGVPTGVEVCASMVHGGPFPATTDSRFTAVGVQAARRWLRPVSYQNCPEALLPDALKTANPLGIWRLVNQEWKQ